MSISTAFPSPMVVTPCTLAGGHVVLEPLTIEHVDALWAVGQDPELWRFTPSCVDSLAAMRGYVGVALREQNAGIALPFVAREAGMGRVIGSTRFHAISPEDRRVEIG